MTCGKSNMLTEVCRSGMDRHRQGRIKTHRGPKQMNDFGAQIYKFHSKCKQ